MSDYLPSEVWFRILTTLQMKDVVRCTAVCKSWYSLITNPTFIASHLNLATANNTTHLLVGHYSKFPQEELLCDNDTFNEYAKFEFPFERFRIIGSCNGLLCLSDPTGVILTTILWNPSIRKSMTLPRPNVTFSSHGQFKHHLGFGFDALTNDYKVVRFVHLGSKRAKNPPEVEVELYTLSTGAWRNSSLVDFPYAVYDTLWSQAKGAPFIKGAVHWVAYNSSTKEDSFSFLILAFDMHDEAFHEIMMPEGLSHLELPMIVDVFQDSLSLIFHDMFEPFFNCCIWVMKEYGVSESWTKQFSITVHGELERPLGFTKDGEVLMLTDGGYLISYDLKDKQIKYIGKRDVPYKIWDWFYDRAYMESLVFLDRGADCCDTVTSKLVSTILYSEENKVERTKNTEGNTEKKRKKREDTVSYLYFYCL